jgi:hypothetical protein
MTYQGLIPPYDTEPDDEPDGWQEEGSAVLSQSDTRAIQQMRLMLNEWEGMAVRQATTADSSVASFSWGRFAEGCENADHALHQILLTADSYLDDVHAAAALREGR